MRKVNQEEIASVIRLPGPERFEYFVKNVVDSEKVWGLWKDGWALMAGDGERMALALWPAPEYADLHRNGEWADYLAREVSLGDLMAQLLPAMKASDVVPAVFPTPAGKGVTPTWEELRAAFERELEQYE